MQPARPIIVPEDARADSAGESQSPARPRAYTLHRATVAQDGHSQSEQMLYELLWRSAAPVEGDAHCRIVQIPQSELAEAVRMTTKNLRNAMERLAAKLAIEEMASFDRGTRMARTWKVYSYQAIQQRRREAGMEWVIRDRGVHFVDPKTVPAKPSRVVQVQQAAIPPAQPRESARADAARFVGQEQQLPATPLFPLGLVVRTLQEVVGSADPAFARRLASACRQRVPDASAEEIAHFIREQVLWLGRRPGQANLMHLLLVQVPKCFEGESFRLYRETEQRKQEAERRDRSRWCREARAVLNNSGSSREEREWARTVLEAV